MANWFVALPIPNTDQWIDQVLATAPEELKRFDPADVHLTICFLGTLRPAEAEAVATIIDQLDTEPVTITLGKLRALPRPSLITAISFELERGRDRIAALISDWRELIAHTAGKKPDSRPPLPHITIARPNRKYGRRAQDAARRWIEATTPPPVTLTLHTIALYTWSNNRPIRQFRIVKAHHWS